MLGTGYTHIGQCLCFQRVYGPLREEIQLTRSCKLGGKFCVEEYTAHIKTAKEKHLSGKGGKLSWVHFQKRTVSLLRERVNEVCQKGKWRRQFL